VEASAGDGAAFRVLANYIGAFGGAKNKAPGSERAEAISMTAPVIMPSGEGALATTHARCLPPLPPHFNCNKS
jgi:hypothetical protein